MPSKAIELRLLNLILIEKYFLLLGYSLGVLPLELNKLLIIVVVLSMALTPFLNEAGRRAAEFIDTRFDTDNVRCSTIIQFCKLCHSRHIGLL